MAALPGKSRRTSPATTWTSTTPPRRAGSSSTSGRRRPKPSRRWRRSKKLVVLKARQLGISWLSLSYALWLMLFHPPATVLLFSLREEESQGAAVAPARDVWAAAGVAAVEGRAAEQ